MYDAELIPDVALELTEHVIGFCRCLTELLGDIVFNPWNLIACEENKVKFYTLKQ